MEDYTPIGRMSLIPYFSAALTTASNLCRPLVPVLMEGVEEDQHWKWIPLHDVLSWNAQVRTTFKPAAWTAAKVVSMSASLVRNGSQ